MNYYSVFDKTGKKIADCADVKDAVMMVKFDSTRTYRQIKQINQQTVNVPHIRLEDDLQLPSQQILPQSELDPFIV